MLAAGRGFEPLLRFKPEYDLASRCLQPNSANPPKISLKRFYQILTKSQIFTKILTNFYGYLYSNFSTSKNW